MDERAGAEAEPIASDPSEAPPTGAAVPLVAVVTPTYNGANYRREVMDCVQAQSYPNLVHVVLDNCSADATAEIIADFKGARVPVVSARNPELLPLNANWNAALQLVPAARAKRRSVVARSASRG